MSHRRNGGRPTGWRDPAPAKRSPSRPVHGQPADVERVGQKLEALRQRLTPEPTEAERALRRDHRRLNEAREVYRQAQGVAAPRLYQQAMQMYAELYDASPEGEVGDICLRAFRLITWELHLLDREHFPSSMAIEFASELARRHPASADEWDNLGTLHQNAGAWREAQGCAEVALLCNPNLAAAHANLGACHLAFGDTSEGAACYERAVELYVSSGVDRWGRIGALMLTGRFAEGWRAWADGNDAELDGRLGRARRQVAALVSRPRWQGERLSGRLLLHVEHGHGDAFMMVRWVPQILARVGALTLAVRAPLVPILAGQWPGVDVITWDDPPGKFERCALSYNLPTLFETQRAQDVPPAPYLRALRSFRPLAGDVRVGIRWAGDPAHSMDLTRSTALEAWGPVLAVPGVTFYSLQLGRGSEELRAVGTAIEDLGPELTNWSRTAAAMIELDLVISVDTSCAHLAGALGRPLWILIPAVPEWRWELERTDCPWYGSARLFRQTRAGDWSDVFADVADALRELVQRRGMEAA